jgi:hypothetical protein
MFIVPVATAVAWLVGLPSDSRSSADTLRVAHLASAPILDGRVDAREYGTAALELVTAAGKVRVWLSQHDDFVYIAADLPDSTFYWGDDFVVSLDPAGRGGASPTPGSRQWYLRRLLDSSVVSTAEAGRWSAPGHEQSALGSMRHHADWDVASSSSPTGWMVELRIRVALVSVGPGAPRLAFRTYNDRPSGWWSWPAPAAGVPPQRVERTPDLWIPIRLPERLLRSRSLGSPAGELRARQLITHS